MPRKVNKNQWLIQWCDIGSDVKNQKGLFQYENNIYSERALNFAASNRQNGPFDIRATLPATDSVPTRRKLSVWEEKIIPDMNSE